MFPQADSHVLYTRISVVIIIKPYTAKYTALNLPTDT